MSARDRLDAYIERHVDYDEPDFPQALDTFQWELRAEALRDAADFLTGRGYAIPADLLHIRATAADRGDRS